MSRKAELQKNNSSEKKIFFHTFKYFSTSSPTISIKNYLVRGLLFSLLTLVIAYVIIVFLMVLNIINKKDQISLKNEIDIKSAKLEKQYNSQIAMLTNDYALKHGFMEAEMNHFASRKDGAANLSFLYERAR